MSELSWAEDRRWLSHPHPSAGGHPIQMQGGEGTEMQSQKDLAARQGGRSHPPSRERKGSLDSPLKAQRGLPLPGLHLLTLSPYALAAFHVQLLERCHCGCIWGTCVFEDAE